MIYVNLQEAKLTNSVLYSEQKQKLPTFFINKKRWNNKKR